MRSRARLLGHPIHQMLIVFPLGLLATSVVFDLIDLATGTGAFHEVAYWTLAAGLVGALVSAPFGFIDWLHVPRGTRARRVGALHGAGNLVVTALFAGSWLLREPQAEVPALALALSLGGTALALVTAWLGGVLVSRLGVGVYDDAGLDAPSSLHGDYDAQEGTTPPRAGGGKAHARARAH
ncbi:DUF2231 domain-containing protein [Ramlibacter tataouinensis]|uniref:Candidate membrane protein n=1 Tax=Ramlibacter tataouinensis (strain ATCC BAA-407 / DSM 14655 / LMG 21543 / TTB310) TaxID=365046 RepID=F5Y1L6_RAMTT|nr:DUF2231 domain-containing protein [Ramlibacter tataouinensis]AEG92267.1 candidate membrane protein [Ramlibacter tataouinensis TTB310]